MLASSFVVTVAGGAAACGTSQPQPDPPDLIANPPRLELMQTSSSGVGDAATSSGAGTTETQDAAAPEASQNAGATAAQGEEEPLPQPAQGGKVIRGPDGTCRQFFPNTCPPPQPSRDGGPPVVVMCNPPPPQRVACPPEGSPP
ncbi:hypothetical protein predicted by Glimmer/Critica [Sorangium cellulosum So ce56]|uniref:Uncharacterized protein n=1 Tax=Sorangium cellulosum (strain So ce56) TaxID=448385 RepID=A9FFQ6_SORC5|nr:hypothetical protein predicted by Glimmer/Critica [Sorangium cellulosum So ce56]